MFYKEIANELIKKLKIQTMKTFLRIFLVFFFLIVAASIIIPLILKDEIMQKVKVEINKSVKARVDWTDFSISLIRGFPDLKISLDNMSVVGIDNFEGDTLVAFDRLDAKIDLFSVFSNKIKVKTILLNRPVVRALVLADGSVNWDITYPSEEITEEEPADTSMALTIGLKKFEVVDGSFAYLDKELDMATWLEGFNFTLTGDFTEVYSDLIISSTTNSFIFEYEGMKYINGATLDVDAKIGADLDKYEFTFSDNSILLNDLALVIEGMFGMPNDEDIIFDLQFQAKDASFKSILSLVPALYMKDFEGLKASGNVNLAGDAKGVYNEKEMPKINIALLVNDGYFAYPDLPKAVENVNIDFKMFYDGVYEDNTTVDLNKFHLEIAGNPVDMRFRMITPKSDMQMTGAMKGRFDLASLADVYPVEDMNLTGLVNMDIELMGKMSDLEKENYEAFKADGLFEVMNVEVSGGDIPFPVNIEKISMDFSPQYVNLTSFDALAGKSDIHMNGRLENFIPYMFSDKTIKGQLNFASTFMNLNELMTDSGEEETVEDTGSVMSVIEIPKNIDFIFTGKIDRMLYDKLEITGLLGKITARDGKLLMDNLSMGLLKGNMVMSGEYNPNDVKSPMVNFDFKMSRIDIPSSFDAFNTVKQLAPIAKNSKGNVSVDFNFTSFLDSTMSPVLMSMVGKGRLRSDDIEISQNDAFTKISQLLKNDNLKNPRFRDINLAFEMRNGRVYVNPFDVNISTTQLNIGGDQGIDQTMNYFVNMSIPRNEFGASANDVLENLASLASAKGFDVKAGDKVNVQLKITGTFSDPKISLDVKENLQQAKAEIIEAVQERIQEEVQKVTEDVKEQVNEQVDNIMKQAEEEAEKIKHTAGEAGERLIGEARLQGKNLIKEAGSNPLKKIAAEKTAQEMEKRAKQQADNLNSEAESKANQVLEEARKKADALKNK